MKEDKIEITEDYIYTSNPQSCCKFCGIISFSHFHKAGSKPKDFVRVEHVPDMSHSDNNGTHPPKAPLQCRHDTTLLCKKCDVSPATVSETQSEDCNCTKDPWGGDDYTCSKHETTDQKIERWEKSYKDWQTTFDSDFLNRIYSHKDPTLAAEIVGFIAVMLSTQNKGLRKIVNQKVQWAKSADPDEVYEAMRNE